MGSRWFQNNGGICNDASPSHTISVPVMYDPSKIVDQCVDTTLTNTATTSFGLYGANPTATTGTIVDRSQHTIISSTTGRWTKYRPYPFISLGGGGHLTPGQEHTISLTITNRSSVIMRDTTAQIPYPSMLVNGVSRQISLQVLP